MLSARERSLNRDRWGGETSRPNGVLNEPKKRRRENEASVVRIDRQHHMQTKREKKGSRGEELDDRCPEKLPRVSVVFLRLPPHLGGDGFEKVSPELGESLAHGLVGLEDLKERVE